VPWAGSDRDYTYGELTSRIFSILEANNPELSDKTKVRMKPPQVVSSGSKRTAFVNFNDICKTMHRNPDHVMAFLLAELGTSASVDGNQRLLLKGRFQSKSIEAILKRYITEYVVCQGCKGPETTLSKDNRIYFVQCDNCGAKRSVSAISKGFQAQIGRRKDRRK
jgi:translation initiation factor 2 subunit 2